MDRTVLHCDCNCFYASVECLFNPEIRNRPVAVAGDEQQRHGIILTKNYIAAKYGIKTGEPIWAAKQKCPELVLVEPHFERYIEFAKLTRQIYCDYTDRVEPFGLDEAWLDVTGEDGMKIARQISDRIKYELGITVSIGVSFNKVFAKFGSDYEKPDAITNITRQNYQDIVWNSPVRDLLYVGKATEAELNRMGVYTIGDLAKEPIEILKNHFGKNGQMLYNYSRGLDSSPVMLFAEQNPVKSIGNSTTTSRDMQTKEEAKSVLHVLCDSVAFRLRQSGLKCRCIQISMRDSVFLCTSSKQTVLRDYTDLTRVIYETAVALLDERKNFVSLRSIGVSLSDLKGEGCEQLNFYEDFKKKEKLKTIDKVTDSLHKRFGQKCIGVASLYVDKELTGFNPQREHLRIDGRDIEDKYEVY